MRVGWTSSGGQYLMITDTGPGIPEDEIPTVLSSFGRGSLAIKTAEQGTGLGLPIVKGLIDLHGGRFALRSKLREGTQVTVTFPAERVMQALAPIVDQARSRAACALAIEAAGRVRGRSVRGRSVRLRLGREEQPERTDSVSLRASMLSPPSLLNRLSPRPKP